MKKYEEKFEFDENEIPLLIVDLRVSLFALMYQSQNEEELWTKEELKHFWRSRLHLPIKSHLRQKFQVVIVDDNKYVDDSYWRTRYLKKAEGDFPRYKGNRKVKERPQIYHDFHEVALEVIKEEGFPYLSKLGFEADDFAGAICNLVNQSGGIGRHVILYTVDSDWGQLVNDQNKILFYYCNTPCWKHKLRNEDIIKQWFDERQGITLAEVRDIVDAKVELGDSSDNLVPGSPREVIDLLAPGRELPKKFTKEINKILFNPKPNTNPRKGIESYTYITKKIYEFRCQESSSLLSR